MRVPIKGKDTSATFLKSKSNAGPIVFGMSYRDSRTNEEMYRLANFTA